jgi:acetyltransferase-like isoleucine patch superfamily enzyme
MKAILDILNSIYRLILGKAGMERRIKYLRKQGVKIGKNCSIRTMSFSTEPYLIEIGDHVAIAAGTKFITHEGAVWCFQDVLGGGIFGKIKIGNNVFIGINCIIVLNTTIGDNCIIGAGSVVRGKIPANSVILGNPAKVVMKMDVIKMFMRQNQDLLKTNNLTEAQRDKLVKEHFGIK